MQINAKDFGAVGDGQTDDTQALQSAVDSIQRTGGRVFVPSGLYMVSEPVILTDGITLMGAGMGMTIFKIPDEHNDDIIGLVRTPSGVATQSVMVRDLTLDGNRENQSGGDQYGFYCGVTPSRPESDFDIACLRVEIHDFRGYGFDPHEITTRLTLTDCISHHNDRDGFTLDGVVNGIMKGCIAYENGRHGINLVTDSRYCILSQNISYGNGSNGITIQNRSYGIQVVNNLVMQNEEDGILCSGVDHMIIQNNQVRENKRNGIRISACPFSTVTGNQVSNNSQEEDDEFSEIVIRDNEDTGTFQTMVAMNSVSITGETRSKYGIYEITGEASASQDLNAYIANRIQGAAEENMHIRGRNAFIAGNVEFE
jgi:parallel beta-helix repeat protein